MSGAASTRAPSWPRNRLRYPSAANALATSARTGQRWGRTSEPHATAAITRASQVNRPRDAAGPAAVVTSVTAYRTAATATSACGCRLAARRSRSSVLMALTVGDRAPPRHRPATVTGRTAPAVRRRCRGWVTTAGTPARESLPHGHNCAGADEALRPGTGGPGPDVRGAGRPGDRFPRPERGRQDDDPSDGARGGAPRRRYGTDRRAPVRVAGAAPPG